MSLRTARRVRAARTAGGALAIKAAEWYLPAHERLFDDPLSVELLPAPLRWVLKSRAGRRAFIGAVERAAPGTFGGLVCRTRFIDEIVDRACVDGIRSVVIVGAGMDTRPYRLHSLMAATVWEADLPAVQAAKRQRLTRALGHLPPHVRFVPVELQEQSLEAGLTSCGFSQHGRSLFVMEGVTQYVERHAVETIFRLVGGCADGSEIVFTYVPQAIIDARDNPPGADATRRRMARAGHPWITGFECEHLERWLGELSLHLEQDVGAAFYRREYFQASGRTAPVFELERAAVARVNGAAGRPAASAQQDRS
jgi:methyltransferase (TIGR00027 family)